jgi:polyphenol oxidase
VISRPSLPAGVRTVRETPLDGPVPLFVHAAWHETWPWLVQGTTGRGDGEAFDLGLFGSSPVGATLRRWRALRDRTGMVRVVHSLQVHRARILDHDGPEPGMVIAEGFDGHATTRPGVLLTVSVADCVPISLVAPSDGRIALLHGGWRGTARGILGAGLARLDAAPEAVHVHLGPAICGACYEVGPEVHAALGLEPPAGNTPVDVRAVLARQALAAGVPPGNVSVSEHCTRCGDGFFSHRGGSAARQLGILGLRA